MHLNFFLATAFIILGCSTPNKSDASSSLNKNKIAAVINGKSISTEDIASRLQQLMPTDRQNILGNDLAKKRYLEKIFNERILLEEARNRGYENSKDVQLTLKKALLKKIRGEIIAGIPKNLEPTQKEVKDAYNKDLTRYVRPEKFRINFAIIDSNSVQNFDARMVDEIAAAMFSDDKDLATPTQLGWERAGISESGKQFFTRDEVLKKFGPPSKKIFANLKNNNPTLAPYKIGGNFYILRISDVQRKRDIPFEKVRSRIRSELIQIKHRALFTEAILALPAAKDSHMFPENFPTNTILAEM